MKGAYNEIQKMFLGSLKNMRQKKATTLININDRERNVIKEEDNIMERWNTSKNYWNEKTQSGNYFKILPEHNKK